MIQNLQIWKYLKQGYGNTEITVQGKPLAKGEDMELPYKHLKV